MTFFNVWNHHNYMKWPNGQIGLIQPRSSLDREAKSDVFILIIVFYSDYQSPGLVL